jgi:hypothetical protein
MLLIKYTVFNMKVGICSKNLMENSVCEYLLFLIQVIVLCTLFSGIYEKEYYCHKHERQSMNRILNGRKYIEKERGKKRLEK